MRDDYQIAWHTGDQWPEWGSQPRRPLVTLSMAHKGEWLDSVIGPDVGTGKPIVYHILRCELCIACHVMPLPDPQALAQYYATTFYAQDKPESLARAERDREWWERCVYAPLLEQAHWHVKLDCPEETQIRLLDIGAGPGVCLDVAARRGWRTSAIEPHQGMCALLDERGHQAFWGTLEQYTRSRGRVDTWHILVAQEVLEHQPSPDDWLMECYDLLEPGGVIILVVPNDYNPLQLEACQRFGLPRYWLSPPQHLFYWTPKTLQLCVRRCGYSIIDMRGTYPLELFMLDNAMLYVGNDAVGREIHGIRMAEELQAVARGQWAQREAQYRGNLTQRIGREIVCVAQKPWEAR